VTAGDQPYPEYEAALRKLPSTQSLALRLRDASVAPEVCCEYLHIEPRELGLLVAQADRRLLELLRDN
jgi:hypothetical protein